MNSAADRPLTSPVFAPRSARMLATLWSITSTPSFTRIANPSVSS
jgi:hypothetical protein